MRPQRWPRAKLTIVRYGAKLLDDDNLIAGAKGVVRDNLRDMGYFEDDSPEKLVAVYTQYVGKPYRTVITVCPD